jgi:hypothetical protein
MISNQDDTIMRTLAKLRSPAPSADRVQRMRSRCHTILAQRRGRQSSLEERPSAARFLDVMLLLVLGVYLAGAVSEAVRLGSFL